MYPVFLESIIITVWVVLTFQNFSYDNGNIFYKIQHLIFTKHSGQLADKGDNFVDGAVIAAARTLPTWSDGDVPLIPSMERKAVKELQEECQQMLAQLPTTSAQDQKLLGEHFIYFSG